MKISGERLYLLYGNRGTFTVRHKVHGKIYLFILFIINLYMFIINLYIYMSVMLKK